MMIAVVLVIIIISILKRMMMIAKNMIMSRMMMTVVWRNCLNENWMNLEPCLQGKVNWQRLMQTIMIFFYSNLRNLFQIIRNWIGYIDIWCEMSDVDCLQGHRVPQLLCSNAANFTAETCSTSTCKAVLVKFSLKQNLEVFSKIWGCCRQLGMASASVPVVLIANLWKVMKVYQLPPNNSNL